MGKKKGKDPAKKSALQAKKEAKAEKSARKRLDKDQLQATAAAPTADAGLSSSAASVPSPRANATFTVNQDNKNEVYLFGGEFFDGVSNRTLDELWMFNLKTKTWKLVIPTNTNTTERPPPRCAHTCVYYNHGLYIFGGERLSNVDQEFHYHYRDCWRFDIKKQTWDEVKLPKIGCVPTARSGHSTIVWKHYMILFGGFHHEAVREVPRWFNDVYVMDLHSLQWQDIPHSNLTKRPEKRSACNVALLPDQECMIVQGGFSKLEKRKSTSTTGTPDSSSTATTPPETMVHTDAWLLHLKPLLQGKPPTWERLTSSVPRSQLDQMVVNSKNPLGRSGTSAVVYKTRMLVAGGVIDKEHYHHRMESVFYNDLHALDIQRRKWFPVRTVNASTTQDGSKRRRKKVGKQQNGTELVATAAADDADDDVYKEDKTAADAEEETDDDSGGSDLEENDEVEEEANNENAGWDIQKLSSTLFAFPDGEGNLVYEKNVVDIGEKSKDGDRDESSEIEGLPSSSVMTFDPETKALQATVGSEPLPRIKSMLVVSGHTLYMYGGLVEVGDREVTLDDMWCLDLRKRVWECLYEGSMHSQVWRGAADDDDDSYVSTGGGDMKEEEEEEDEDDDEDDEDGNDEETTEAVARLHPEIAELKETHNLDSVNQTPLPGEALADFYARTSDHWNEQAGAANESVSLSTKELKRQGFSLARTRFEQVEPVLKRIQEL